LEKALYSRIAALQEDEIDAEISLPEIADMHKQAANHPYTSNINLFLEVFSDPCMS
jgi:hypothetical protein